MLDDKLKQYLIEAGITRQFDAGTELLRVGQYIKVVPVVLSGSIRVVREDESGRELLLYFVGPDESCVMTIFAVRQNTPSLIRAVVEEPVTVLLLPVERVQKELSSQTTWLDFTFALFLQRFEELLNMVNDIAFRQVDERLLDLLRTRARLSSDGIIHATHQQLADDIGSAREVISRLLKRLEGEGKVQLGRGSVKIISKL